MATPVALADHVLAELKRVAGAHGTPCYAYDLGRLRLQLARLRQSLPLGVELRYSVKANPLLDLCQVIAGHGLGADVVSRAELETALAAGFAAERVQVSGPYKPPALLERLRGLAAAVVSVDSRSELEALVASGARNRLILRLRPDFTPASAVMPTGQGSRFGVPLAELGPCRRSGSAITGFHVFAGSQVLDAQAVVRHLRSSCDLALRAGEVLGIEITTISFGGGFGVPYEAGGEELDLRPIAAELEQIGARVAPARIALELGRYVVAQCGWYLTRVVAHQEHCGRRAVVVDGGVHQRADLCGLDLRGKGAPPSVLTRRGDGRISTDVLGCLCLPDDVLAEASLLPALELGDILAFPNAGAYGLTASPVLFLGHPRPAEVGFDSNADAMLGIDLLASEGAPEALVRGAAAAAVTVGIEESP
jgi:diaminopimelate decarboxylase